MKQAVKTHVDPTVIATKHICLSKACCTKDNYTSTTPVKAQTSCLVTAGLHTLRQNMVINLSVFFPVWNSITNDVRSAGSLTSSKSCFKTYLFHLSTKIDLILMLRFGYMCSAIVIYLHFYIVLKRLCNFLFFYFWATWYLCVLCYISFVIS